MAGTLGVGPSLSHVLPSAADFEPSFASCWDFEGDCATHSSSCNNTRAYFCTTNKVCKRMPSQSSFWMNEVRRLKSNIRRLESEKISHLRGLREEVEKLQQALSQPKRGAHCGVLPSYNVNRLRPKYVSMAFNSNISSTSSRHCRRSATLAAPNSIKIASLAKQAVKQWRR